VALREVLADLSVRVRGTRQLQGANRGVNAFVGNMRAAAGALGAAGAAVRRGRWTLRDGLDPLVFFDERVFLEAVMTSLSAGGDRLWRRPRPAHVTASLAEFPG